MPSGGPRGRSKSTFSMFSRNSTSMIGPRPSLSPCSAASSTWTDVSLTSWTKAEHVYAFLGLLPTCRGAALLMDGDRLLSLAVDVAAARDLQGVLQTITQGLASHPGVALARIWLRLPGDICESCFLRADCSDRTQCFHLVASSGTPVNSPEEDWSYLQGYFRRIPMNAFKVGQVGSTGTPMLIEDAGTESEHMVRPEWVQREGIRSFAGHPFIFRDRVLGVLATFTREPLDERAFGWLG